MLEDLTTATQHEVFDNLLDWAHRNAVAFDPQNSQSQACHQEVSTKITVNGIETETVEHISWLGMHLDSYLTSTITQKQGAGWQ